LRAIPIHIPVSTGVKENGVAIEEGVVIKVAGETAWVKTRRGSACASCSARHACASPEGDGQEMEVETINLAGAAIGDHVVISIESAALLKASFLLYVFPIICMIAGAFAGNAAGPFFNMEGSTASVVSAACFFGISFLVIRYRGTRMADNRHYRPKIIRIKKFPAPR
jgi:sigma-E factor negative regulatory protein RseC